MAEPLRTRHAHQVRGQLRKRTRGQKGGRGHVEVERQARLAHLDRLLVACPRLCAAPELREKAARLRRVEVDRGACLGGGVF